MSACIACSNPPTGLVHDGGWRTPVCDTHTRLYRAKGYTVTPTTHRPEESPDE